MKDRKDCLHEDFKATVRVDRLLDTGLVMATTEIACAECGQPFRFAGVARAGHSNTEPSVDVTETKLCCPVEPYDEVSLRANLRYDVPPPLPTVRM